MIQSSLTSLLNLFQRGSSEEQQALFNEATLMILSRATSADSNIHPIEVDTVQEIVKETTGESVSSADIRVAANSSLYERAPMRRYVEEASRILTLDQRLTILNALVEVIKSDQIVTKREVDFFNVVAGACDVTAADVMGLRISSK